MVELSRAELGGVLVAMTTIGFLIGVIWSGICRGPYRKKASKIEAPERIQWVKVDHQQWGAE